jgi:hypothetical protein
MYPAVTVCISEVLGCFDLDLVSYRVVTDVVMNLGL